MILTYFTHIRFGAVADDREDLTEVAAQDRCFPPEHVIFPPGLAAVDVLQSLFEKAVDSFEAVAVQGWSFVDDV